MCKFASTKNVHQGPTRKISTPRTPDQYWLPLIGQFHCIHIAITISYNYLRRHFIVLLVVVILWPDLGVKSINTSCNALLSQVDTSKEKGRTADDELDDTPKKRLGRLLVCKLGTDNDSVTVVQERDTAAILDVKWCGSAMRDRPTFALVNATGQLVFGQLNEPGERDALCTEVTEVKVTDDGLALSLSWHSDSRWVIHILIILLCYLTVTPGWVSVEKLQYQWQIIVCCKSLFKMQ